MRFPLTLLGLIAQALAVQVPLQSVLREPNQNAMAQSNFAFKEASDIFSPKDLVGLGRPGTGVANPDGDLVMIPFSQYSFEEKQCVVFP